MATLRNEQAALEPQPDVAREFFSTIGQVHLVAIYPDGQLKGKFFGSNVDGAVEWAEDLNKRGYGIYWTCNAVRPGFNIKPGKADIAFARFAHSDIDPKQGIPFDKREVQASLNALPCPPSFVIDSGGGLQPFWRLDEPCENWEQIEDINIGICDLLGADHCWSIEHLVRVPGFVNYPNKKKRDGGRGETLAQMAQIDDGVVYQPHVLAAAYPVTRDRTQKANRPTGKGAIGSVKSTGAQFLSTHDIGAGDYLTGLIDGPIPERHGNDRSKWGLLVAGQMAREGYLDADIAGILLNSANACSAHFVDAKNPQRAVDRAIAEVRTTYPEPTVVDVDFACDEAIPEVASCIDYTVPEGEPGWLRDLGDNPIAEYVRTVVDASIVPQPWLALGSAVSTFGVLAGHHYRNELGKYCNFYCLLLADSGRGKDAPLKASIKLLEQASLINLYTGWPASDVGLHRDLSEHNPLLIFKDELHEQVRAIVDPRSTASARGILTVLTDMFSAAGGVYAGKSYAKKEYDIPNINKPHLCMLGASPASSLFNDNLTPAHFEMGAIPRMMIWEADSNAQRRRRFRSPGVVFSSRIVNLATKLHEGPESLNILQKAQRQAVEISFTPEAFELQDDQAIEWDEQARKFESGKAAIIVRKNEQAIKLALLKRVCESPNGDQPITKGDIEWAYSIVDMTAASLLNAFDDRVSSNKHESNVKKVKMAFLAANKNNARRGRKDKIVARADLYKTIERLDGPHVFDQVVDEWIKQGLIEKVQNKTAGRPSNNYKLMTNLAGKIKLAE